MVHLHRPLRDRVQREAGRVDAASSNGGYQNGKRIEIGRDARAVLLRRHGGAVALRRQTEALQGLDIELEHDRLRRADQPHRGRGFEIGLVGVLVEELLRRQFVFPEAAVGDVAVELFRVGRAPALRRRPRRASRRAARCRGCARAARCNPCSRRDSAARRRRRQRPAVRAARRARSARPGTAARRGRAGGPAGGSNRPDRRRRRSDGRAARCSPSARDTSCRAGSRSA